jgi:hypothetical protein
MDGLPRHLVRIERDPNHALRYVVAALDARTRVGSNRVRAV